MPSGKPFRFLSQSFLRITENIKWLKECGAPQGCFMNTTINKCNLSTVYKNKGSITILGEKDVFGLLFLNSNFENNLI